MSVVQILPYTDDTAMTKSVAESLYQMKTFDAKDMAKRFAVEYFKEPKRGYGNNVIDVFAALNRTHFERPFEPARQQFNGSGSYGNGAAMRTGPVPLFGFFLSDEQLAELAINCAKITHSNRNGYNGAVLQSFAIREALNTKMSSTDHSFDAKLFLSSLIDKFKKIEAKDFDSDYSLETNKAIETPFTDKLIKIQEIFSNESKLKEMTSERVVYTLGNDVSALKSVPTAIYSVLRGQNPIEGCPSDNPFVRTLYFSISLGGDTDTIASMACSIAGALYGIELIPDIIQKCCEDNEVMHKYGQHFYQSLNIETK